MPKFYGNIGYAISKETAPGVWVEDIVERKYSGDVYRNTRKLQSGNQVNDSIDISNEISILSDPFAILNYFVPNQTEPSSATGSSRTIADWILVRAPDTRVSIRYLYWLKSISKSSKLVI